MNKEEYSHFSPHLTFLLRDFSLEIKDENNNLITPDEYLENSIAHHEGSSKNIKQINEIRETIRLSFPR